MTIDLDKSRLRAAASALRRRLADAQGDGAALALAQRVGALPPLPADAVVAGYWPLADEIDPRPLMNALAACGAALALPVVAGRDLPLRFRRWRAGEALEAGPHGTRHPPPAAPETVPSVLLVPLLAFDRCGYRLGYGGGYYDRTLAALRRQGPILAIGVAFAGQLVDHVPHDPWDQPLDGVLTDLGWMDVERS